MMVVVVLNRSPGRVYRASSSSVVFVVKTSRSTQLITKEAAYNTITTVTMRIRGVKQPLKVLSDVAHGFLKV
jgi:hypothetical protein